MLEWREITLGKGDCTLLVDCHSHIWAYPGHLSDEFVNEANARSRGHKLDLDIPPEKHFEAMAGVDKVIVFGLRAHHSGLWVPNDYIAGYAASPSRESSSDLARSILQSTRSRIRCKRYFG
jgi:hypothetical protein